MTEEKKLVLRARHDERAFDALYEQYFPMINNFVYRRVHNTAAKDDIVSNVFFKAFKKIYQFRFSGKNSSFSAWLYRIAVNEIMQYYRNEKRDRELLHRAKNDYETNQAKSMSIDYSVVDQEIRKLTEFEQNLITLRYFEKLSFKEVSYIVGKKEGALKVQMHRTLHKLRALIEGALKNEGL